MEKKQAENPEIAAEASGNGDAAVAMAELHGKDGARAFASRLNSAKEQWAADFQKQFFAEMGLTDPENGEIISDKPALRRALEAMLAEQEEFRRRDAEQQMKIRCLEELVTDLQDSADADALKKDAVSGAYFAQYGEESRRLADFARERGTPISLEAAFHTVLMNDAPSRGFQLNGRLYLLDGENYLYLEGNTVASVASVAYVPRILISKNPNGSGGTLLEGVNALGDRWIESFYGQDEIQTYQLSFGELSDDEVEVFLLSSDGTTYLQPREGVDFTVERYTGLVTFTNAPGASPVEGVDNVFIHASRDRSQMRRRITESDVLTSYGEYGNGARIFVSGCPQYPNRDFWSHADDPTYFSENDYAVLGQSDSRIVGYSILGDSLATFKDDADGSVYIRTGGVEKRTDAAGDTVTDFSFFTVNVISGRGAVAGRSFATLNGEALFLTRRGVCALTPSDLTGEKYEQNRSFFLDTRLTAETNASEAAATVYRDFYVLAFPSGTVYLLDGLQKSYQKDQPYSTFQYEGYIWSGICARCIWTEQNMLCFGDAEGNIWHFYTDAEDPESYQDNGEAIAACWETGDLSGDRFYAGKHFRRWAIRLSSAASASVLGEYRKEGGAWQPMVRQTRGASFFRFSALQFSRLTFRCDQSTRTLVGKLNLHGVDKLRFRFRNESLKEPFGLENMAFDYVQSGIYRR